MHLLADENVPASLVGELRSPGHDVIWARTDYAGFRDNDLLEIAETEGRILLTLDKDFLQIALQGPNPLRNAGVVLFRVHPATPATLLALVRWFRAQETDWRGHVSTITARGVHMVSTAR
jgi:predicted nuclease of predicted toxin-antitoxin system